MTAPPGTGHLSLVSVGPGDLSLVPERARDALLRADVIVAYDLYLRWVAPLITTQEVLTPPLTQEKERARLAIEHARGGQRVALVSSGDIGVYAMAGLVFEDLPESPDFGVEVIPGITSATACASLLGSPLTHDFATLSLSDLLCPWEWIEHRARHIAEADLACVLYNVQSRARQEGVYRVLRLMLEHKRPETVCGVVRNAYRGDQEVRVTTLGELLEQKFDMLTTVVIGNRFTGRKGQGERVWMYTPRGYNDWQPDAAPEVAPAHALPENAVWVYGGTRDGNALALSLAEAGQQVILSVATDLGAQVAPAHPRVRLYNGPAGAEARRRALRGARAVVDATHPYAGIITPQLREITTELGVPYLRYERPSSLPDPLPDGVVLADSFADAARMAAPHGRVFLATGSKDLTAFREAAPTTEVFVRVTPQPEVMARVLELGVPPRNVSAMVGPFSQEFNVAQWRAWGVGAVVTKDSGAEGGLPAKLGAARELGVPLIVVRRPEAVPGAFSAPEALMQAIKELV